MNYCIKYKRIMVDGVDQWGQTQTIDDCGWSIQAQNRRLTITKWSMSSKTDD